MSDWQSMPRNYITATLLLLAGLLATGYATYTVKSGIDSDVQHQFAFDCNKIQSKIEKRLQTHRLVLLGGAALFDASDRVTRDNWRAYANRVEIDQHFQGIQGLGFSLLIPKKQLALHTSEIRSQGFPEYSVSPAGERDPYSSIIYLEPFKDRNLRAFGYDMYSEPVRRAAMQQARDENIVALSGKVELVQETTKDMQAGTLMYVPVYRKSMPIETVEQRRAALYGWVYSPFRMGDLLQGVLEGWDDPLHQHLRLQVYDGHTLNADSLLYRSKANMEPASPALALFSLEQHINFNGREWTLHFEQMKGSVSGTDYSKAWMVLAGGSGLSFLSFLLMLSYLNTRRNAVRIAAGLTAELREASGYARSLIEASLDPLVTISAEGKITDVNQATEQVTGRNRAELVGTDFSDYFTEPDQARDGYRQVFSEGSVTDYPLAIRHRDGHITGVLYNASLYRDVSGKVLGVFAAARDITERKLAEGQLQRSEHSLREAQRIAHLGSWDLDLAKNELTWSPEIYRIFEIDPEKFGASYDAFLDAIHPDDRARVNNAYNESVKNRTRYNIEHRLLMKDGRIKYVHEVGETYYGEDGKALRSFGIVHDVSERKQAEAALARHVRDLGERVKEIECLRDVTIMLLDKRPSMEQVLDACARRIPAAWLDPLHTCARIRLGGQTYESANFRESAWKLAADISVAGMGSGLIEVFYVGEVAEGEKTPFLDEEHTLIGSLALQISQSLEKRLDEEKIRQINIELEQRVEERTAKFKAANQELEAFAYSVSHDLRVPLRAIDGFSHLLLAHHESRLDDEGKRLLHVVCDNTVRMGQLINDILAFSRAGRMEIKSTKTDMEALAREVWEELEPSRAGRAVQLDIKPLPEVQGDAAMLRQVWSNLLGNAIKFTKNSAGAHIEIGSSVQDGENVFYVKDNGAGFDMQYADKLFGVFQRLHGVEEFEGTGIGLAIVKRIATRHGGRVWAEGKVNGGATIYFALPV